MNPRNPTRRILALIGHLELAATQAHTANDVLAELEDQAIWDRTTTQGQSTISTRHIGDPTSAAAHRIGPTETQRRAVNTAIQSVERAVVHLRHELDRACGTSTTSTAGEQRCPDMILEHDGYDNVLRPCGQLSQSWQRPDGSTAWRQDARCIDHGTSHDQEQRRAQDSNLRRQRRHAS